MSRYRETPLDCKVYVGNLPRDASEKELERAFSYYGPLKSVWVARNPSGFAFVEFDDARDADDAVRGLDGTTLCGERIRVEMSSGKVRPKPWQRNGGGGRPPRRPIHPDDRCYECGDRGHYAADCRRRGGGGGGGGGSRGGAGRRRSRSYSPRYNRRSYSRSRSRSRGPSQSPRQSRDNYSPSPQRSRSRSR